MVGALFLYWGGGECTRPQICRKGQNKKKVKNLLKAILDEFFLTTLLTLQITLLFYFTNVLQRILYLQIPYRLALENSDAHMKSAHKTYESTKHLEILIGLAWWITQPKERCGSCRNIIKREFLGHPRCSSQIVQGFWYLVRDQGWLTLLMIQKVEGVAVMKSQKEIPSFVLCMLSWYRLRWWLLECYYSFDTYVCSN